MFNFLFIQETSITCSAFAGWNKLFCRYPYIELFIHHAQLSIGVLWHSNMCYFAISWQVQIDAK